MAHHQHQLDIACPQKALPGHITSTSCVVAARAMHIISISCTFFMSGGSRAARIISISWFLPVPNELCQRASAASVGRCLEGASPGSVHHQHQLDIACPEIARKVQVMSISWIFLWQNSGQYASSASAAQCVSGNTPGNAHQQHQLCIISIRWILPLHNSSSSRAS